MSETETQNSPPSDASPEKTPSSEPSTTRTTLADASASEPAPGGDGKASEAGAAEGGDGGGQDAETGSEAAAEPEGAPEAYELTPPEGWTEIDPDAMAAFEPVLRELNLTNESAQRLVDVYGEQLTRAIEGVGAEAIANADAAAAEREIELGETLTAMDLPGWDVKPDADNRDHPASRLAVQGAEALLGGPEAANAWFSKVDATGATPLLVPLLAKIGRAAGEDGFPFGGKAVQVDPIAAMYPNDVRPK